MMNNFNKFLILTFIIFMSCNNLQKTDHKVSAPKFKYLALGDSYTIGESVVVTDRWPNQLSDSMLKNDVDLGDPRIIAKTGWTTDELLTALKDSVVDKDYDLVSLLIGVNNQYRGQPVEKFRLEFNQLLDLAIDYAAGNSQKVFVLSIPDWGVTPFAKERNRTGVGAEIDLYNQVKEEECNKRNILFVNITDLSREAKAELDLLAEDGLHPSGKMYARWVNRSVSFIQKVLNN